MTEPSSAIGMLMHEHRVILRAIADMRAELERDVRERAVDVEYVATVADFIRTYADRCHHGKEEDILFRGLAEKPMPADLADAMQRLIDDHVWARATTRAMVEAAKRYAEGDSDAYEDVVASMGALAEFYPGHIEREDHGFFKPAIDLFSAEEREAMAEAFRDFDRHLIHEHYLGVVEKMEADRLARG